MSLDLSSMLFGAALGVICSLGLVMGVWILFEMMQAEAKNPDTYSKSERIQRYILSVSLILGQMLIVVTLIFKFSEYLKSPLSWGIGLSGAIFIASLLMLMILGKRNK